MAVDVLADTGAILALLDRCDLWHKACVAAFSEVRLPLLTSEAVLTELFHMVQRNPLEKESAWQLIRSGVIRLAAIDHSELSEIYSLMMRYWDCPMDFADATLVYLARREGLSTVFTVDHADFLTYRIQGRKRFRIVPPPRPND